MIFRVPERLVWKLEQVVKLFGKFQLVACNFNVLVFLILELNRIQSTDLLSELRETLPVEVVVGGRIVEIFLDYFVGFLLK